MDRLVMDRNEMMLTNIERILQNGGINFVIVGAGHLVGQRGIINRLREKGYSVDQM